MASVKAQDVFISAAANRSSHVADWASVSDKASGQQITVLAYGSNRNIALAYNFGEHDLNYRGVSELLPTPFTSAVTTVKYIRPASGASLDRLILVAGAGNGQAAIWTGVADRSASVSSSSGSLWKPLSWTLVASLKPTSEAGQTPFQTGTVQAIGVSQAVRGDDASSTATVAVGTSDGTITLWKVSLSDTTAEVVVSQVISASKDGLASALPLDIAFANLAPIFDASPSAHPLLMTTASTDRKIIFWVRDSTDAKFRKSLVLTGHDDWVRSLDFSVPFPLQGNSDTQSTQLELASGSQDGSVRLWRLRPHTAPTASSSSANTLDAFDRLAKQVEDEANQNNDATGASLSNKTHIIDTAEGPWAITFDALLTGHEAWVSGVRWHPPTVDANGSTNQPAALLSASVDNSIIFWTPSGLASKQNGRLTYPSLTDKEATSSLWLPAQRFGELGVAGAGALGMFGALWNPEWHSNASRQLVASHAWAGAVHLWAFESDKWVSCPAITGHHLPAKSARWSPNGDWFLTASLDRTARLFGEHNRPAARDSDALTTWHELARPQTHGYDIMNASWLDNLAFASAADEKVSRIFAAPQGFVQSAKRLGAIRRERHRGGISTATHNVLAIHLPTAAHARNPSYFQSVISKAASQTCKSAHSHLYIVVSSPLFNGLASGNGGVALSFKEMESLLTLCYGFAWAAAVKEGNLLADVDVLLSAETKVDQTLRRLAGADRNVGHLWAVDEASLVPAALSKDSSSSHPFSVEYLQLDSAAIPRGQDASSASEPFPQHESLAIGGTFDHLHVGHKILLSMAALICTQRIIVAVTVDSMLAKKKNPQLLETIEERQAAVRRFLTEFRSTMSPIELDVTELADVCGPTATDAELQALLVTEETLAGADTIAKTRSERGMSELKSYTIGVVGSGGETDVKGDASELAAAKIGSTAIREWLSKQSLQAQAKARRKRRQDKAAQMKHEQEARPMAASVPALGLSNRAVFDGQAPEAEVNELGRKVEAPSSEPVSSVFTRPPVEEELLVSTLWPELDKLYGHGYELLAADSSLDGGRLTATSCKSTSSEHAVVRVYDRANNWKEIAALPGHSLTITRIRFSPDSKWILTVSRDRSWRLFHRQDLSNGQVKLTPFVHKEAAHARIIWDAAWSDDSRTFATASRDKSVKVWRLASPMKSDAGEESVTLLASVARLPDAATAVAFDERERLAVGLENGTVLIYQLQGQELKQVLALPHHHATVVNELGWRPPMDGDEDEEDALLLSCGEDGAVRLVRVI